MATKDLGPLFFDSVRSYNHPWCSLAYSQETEEPYRQGHGIAIRVTKRFVLVVGWWRRPVLTEDEALFSALKASTHREAGPIAEGEAWLGED